jgi:transcriptional regulator of PTS gene
MNPKRRRKGDHELMRTINRAALLDHVRQNPGTSQSEISQVTGLAPATVSEIVSDMIADQYLVINNPTDNREKQRGRPRSSLFLNAQAAYVAGVKISMHQISVSVTDFVGEPLSTVVIPIRANRHRPEVVADLVEDCLLRAIRDIGLSVSDIAGICIGVPGFVDSEKGVCHWSPVFSDVAVPFAELMRSRLKLPTQIENDANLVALAEQWFGLGQEVKSLVVVTVEHGVGMGLVLDGKLYRGANGFAAEFGHTAIDPDGNKCRCGQRGCIEAYVADYAILRAAAGGSGEDDNLDPLKAHDAIEELTLRARQGDGDLVKLFENAGRILGMGVANLINILNPELIVFSGDGMRAADLLMPSVLQEAEARAVQASKTRTRFEVHRWGDEVWARGAAAAVLMNLYQSPSLG